MPPAPGSAEHRRRLTGGLRLLVLSAALLAAVGALGHALDWVLLTTTLGPTAYLLLAHPDQTAARTRNAVIGHACAAASGLAFLAALGLWSHRSVVETKSDTWPQIGAQALAVGVTLFLLTLFDAPHPPAAATALLIASGIARPGPSLYGMLVGLAILIAVAPWVAQVRVGRAQAESGDGR